MNNLNIELKVLGSIVKTLDELTPEAVERITAYLCVYTDQRLCIIDKEEDEC